jgi:hypothetical protein
MARPARVPGTFARSTHGQRLGDLREVEVPGPTAALPGDHRAFTSTSGCNVIVAREPAKAAPGGIWLPPEELLLWHLSISHPDRYPSWDEIGDARYQLTPGGITMALLLPPMGEYVNAHPFCFHLWQIDDRRVDR